jgi:hypothetical protein
MEHRLQIHLTIDRSDRGDSFKKSECLRMHRILRAGTRWYTYSRQKIRKVALLKAETIVRLFQVPEQIC